MTLSKAPTMQGGLATGMKWAAIIAAAAGLLAASGESFAQAEKKEVAKGIAAPSVAETKAIAEEGFIPQRDLGCPSAGTQDSARIHNFGNQVSVLRVLPKLA